MEKSQICYCRNTKNYYNFVKPHQNLGGKTPAEKVGTKLTQKNKWLELIQNKKG
jgi:hypothetical protein